MESITSRMTTLLLAIAFIITGWSAASRAQALTGYDQYAYQYVRNICSPSSGISGSLHMQLDEFLLMGHGFLALMWPHNPKDMVEISPTTRRLIHSEGYFKGLDECFGNRQEVKKLFTASLILDDVEGHLAGVAVFIATGFAFKALEGTAWGAAHPILLARTTKFVLWTGGVGVVTSAIAEAEKIHKAHYLKEHPVQALTPNSQAVDSLDDQAFDLMAERLAEIQDELAAGRLDSQCSRFPANRRQELCREYLLRRQSEIKDRMAHQQFGSHRSPTAPAVQQP